MSDQLEFKVSEGLVRPIIEAKINSAIIEAMGGHERMIVEMVTAFMNQKVDGEGKTGGYNSNKPRYEWLTHKLLEDAVRKALQDYLDTKKEVLAREVQKFFSSKKGTNLLVEAVANGVLSGLGKTWRTTITFNAPNR